MKTQKGASALSLILIIAIVIAVGFFFLSGKSDEVADTAVDQASQKAQELTDAAAEKATDVVKEKSEELVDAAVENGKEAIGQAVIDAGEKLVQSGSGVYDDYSPEKVAANDGAVLYFRADWCPTCRALDKDIEANLDQIPADLAILKVDFDAEKELKKQYGVTLQHSFIQVDKDGAEITSWRGGNTLESVLRKVQ